MNTYIHFFNWSLYYKHFNNYKYVHIDILITINMYILTLRRGDQKRIILWKQHTIYSTAQQSVEIHSYFENHSNDNFNIFGVNI